MQTIGEKIKELSKQKGVSQEETAYELGVTRQTVSKWESGVMQPNAESIKALSDYFAVSPECFFGDEAVGEAAVSVAKPVQNKKTAFIICLVLLIVSVLACLILTFFAACFGNIVFSPNVGYVFVSNVPEAKDAFVGCLTGSIIFLGAIVGLTVALVKFRK